MLGAVCTGTKANDVECEIRNVPGARSKKERNLIRMVPVNKEQCSGRITLDVLEKRRHSLFAYFG